MSDAAREEVHRLVDELPEEELQAAKRMLDEFRRRRASSEREVQQTRRAEALKRIDERNQRAGLSTSAEQVDAWIRASRP